MLVRCRCRRLPVRRFSQTPANSTPTNAKESVLKAAVSDASATGPKKRSFFRTLLMVTGVPLFASGSAVAAYHFSDDFRHLVDSNIPTEIIEDLKNRFHTLVRPSADITIAKNGVKDDFELARQPDVPLEDLEESPKPNGMPSISVELLKSDQFRAYMHVIAQEREDELREEFNANLDQRIEKRLEEQLESKQKEIQSKYDADLLAKQRDLEEKYESEKRSRLQRLAVIESQVDQVDRIVKNCEENLHQSEKAHALATAAIGLETALEASASFDQDLAPLRRFSDDPTVSVLLSSLPNRKSGGPVTTIDQIKNRFQTVSKACRQAALVPPDSGIAGHVIGRVFSALLINRDFYDYGDNEISKIHRAQYFLSHSELENAIKEMESLDHDGLAYSLASDWISEAKQRLALQQVANVLKLYAYELSRGRVGAAGKI